MNSLFLSRTEIQRREQQAVLLGHLSCSTVWWPWVPLGWLWVPLPLRGSRSVPKPCHRDIPTLTLPTDLYPVRENPENPNSDTPESPSPSSCHSQCWL